MTESISSEDPPLNRIALLQRIIEQLLMNWLYQLCWLSHVKYTSNPVWKRLHNSKSEKPKKGDQTDVDTSGYSSRW